MDGDAVPEGRRIYGLGTIYVSSRDEEIAKEAGGNPIVEILDSSSPQSGPRWSIVQMTPRHPDVTAQWHREKLRYDLLRWYFDAYQLSPDMRRYDVGYIKQTGTNDLDVKMAWDYLWGQKLLTNRHSRHDRGAIISHEGIREIERKMAFPHSPSNNLGIHMNQTNNFGEGNFANVQIGDSNSASVNQTIGITGDELTNLSSLLHQEIARLPIEEQPKARDLVQGILEETEKEEPKHGVISALIGALPGTLQALPALGEFIQKLGG